MFNFKPIGKMEGGLPLHREPLFKIDRETQLLNALEYLEQHPEYEGKIKERDILDELARLQSAQNGV